jgi:RNA polymerase sigma factor (TIGR02999 family)
MNEDLNGVKVTRLLRDWNQGDPRALDELMPLIYPELQRIAVGYFRSERVGHTLQPTALVHEAYARLVRADVAWGSRVHFYAVAARTMRRILVDHARSRRSEKRGGAAVRVTLDERLAPGEPEADLLVLDEALERLAELDERMARVVELHFFGGMTYAETGEAIGVSEATVKRDLRTAKLWLRREMEMAESDFRR